MNTSLRRVLSLQNFRLLFASTALSLLGNQFTLIATPWLVLQVTNDSFVLGTVLALESIPRALFMLVGGAITDRFHPRKVMFYTDIVCLAITGLMAICVLSGQVEIWMLYVFSLCFGLVSGLAVPATNSIVPMLVKKDDLETGNSIIMGITQLAGFIGPTLAGILIAQWTDSTFGIGLAFAIDAVTFAVSALLLWFMSSTESIKENTSESILTSIANGTKFMWRDNVLRTLILILTSANFLLMGPILVGIPLLASQRLAEGASAYGLLMSAFAGGSLLGYVAAGALPRPSGTMMRHILILFIAAFGAVIAALGYIQHVWIDFALLLMLGMGNGYIAILLFTWMQNRTPKSMLGRMMSLLIFANAGLVPVSQALSGIIGQWDLTLLFAVAGALVVCISLIAAFQRSLFELGAGLATLEKPNI